MRLNLVTNFCGVKFTIPLISVSGIVVNLKDIISLTKLTGVGGVTNKSISINSRTGNPLPHIASYGVGFINAVGLKNPGMHEATKELRLLKKASSKPVIASIVAFQMAEFPILCRFVAQAKPDFIELNLSCPNVDDEFGKPFATDPLLSAMAVYEAKKAIKNIPIIAKLTPNTPDLKQVAYEVEKAGADAISAINTVGPGLLINHKTRKPILGNRVGGVSGRGIKPIALRCVNDIYKTVKIPIIGMGGIYSGTDVLDLIMAGATLVGLGSVIYERGHEAFNLITAEFKQIMKNENIKSLKEIRGII